MRKPKSDIKFIIEVIIGFLLFYGFIALIFPGRCSGAVMVAAYGAVGDGITDNTAALQQAFNAGAASNDVVMLGHGAYLISAPLIANCDITGEGEEKSAILIGNLTSDGLLVTASSPVHFERFQIRPAFDHLQQTAGSAIVINSPDYPNQRSTFDRILIDGVYTGFDFVSAAWWHMNTCEVLGCAIGVHVRDVAGVDSGEATITDCSVLCYPGIGAAILQESGGGLRVTGCKLLNGGFGYELNLAPGITTGALVITGCSIEGFRWAGVFFTEQGLGTFLNAVITGNEIGAGTGVEAQSPFGGIWLVGLTVNGNSIVPPYTGGTGIDLNGVTGASISGNSIWSNGGTTWGIILRPQTQLSYVGENSLTDGITYPVTNQGSQNSIQ